MGFKGTKEKWKCIFISDSERAIRTSRGILMVFWKPMRYSGQDERYELELKETQANQILCSKAPEMLDLLIEVMETTTDKIRYEKCKQLIKEATEI